MILLPGCGFCSLASVSSNGWIHDIAKACVAVGIHEFVVCAGARNIELVTALADLERSGEVGEICVLAHFEERAAGFFALGRTMSNAQPCAVVTTSGTAVAELLPAVIEAYYQKRPLVVISADRPMRFRGSGAPQAIEQVGLLGPYVSACEDVTWDDRITLFEGWDGVSPWHLNLCVEEDDLGAQEPRQSKVRVGEVDDRQVNIDMRPLLDALREGWKGVVVMLGGLEPEDREEVWHFLRDLGVPVLADCTSGLREVLGKLVLADGDSLLKQKPPAHVIRIGDIPVGRFWRDLESMPAVHVVSLTRTGFSGLARESQVITGDISRMIRAVGAVESVGDALDYLKISKRARGRVDELLECYPESEPGMVRTLSVMATVGSSLYLGNSLPIREWNDFSQREVPYELVRANRGANGIDGQIASWLGATAEHEGAWGVFGDLTALYDLSAPSLLGNVENKGRVLVVINNHGGRIFERLKAVRSLGKPATEIIANSHQFGFESWATMWNMHYVRIDGIEGFDFEPADDRTTLVELIPDQEQTVDFWSAYEAIKH